MMAFMMHKSHVTTKNGGWHKNLGSVAETATAMLKTRSTRV